MTFRKNLSLYLNELWIIILCGILTGAFIYERINHAFPCPLCLLQRLGMIATAIGPLMNLLFGFRSAHYGLAIIGALFGASVSMRQILLHVCKDFSEYGHPVFGLELYTWAFLVACFSILGTAFLLMLFEKSEEYREKAPLRPLGYIAITFLILIVVANVMGTFLECGFTFCPDNPTQIVY
ncbi:MAG: disulfide bond formation protein B [Simkaniaceae bacterium]|nr:disulfide bond formation protein B [Simkaniaceae bacterium]